MNNDIRGLSVTAPPSRLALIYPRNRCIETELSRPGCRAGSGACRAGRGNTGRSHAMRATGFAGAWLRGVFCGRDMLEMSGYQPPPSYRRFTGSPLEVCGRGAYRHRGWGQSAEMIWFAALPDFSKIAMPLDSIAECVEPRRGLTQSRNSCAFCVLPTALLRRPQ